MAKKSLLCSMNIITNVLAYKIYIGNHHSLIDDVCNVLMDE